MPGNPPARHRCDRRHRRRQDDRREAFVTVAPWLLGRRGRARLYARPTCRRRGARPLGRATCCRRRRSVDRAAIAAIVFTDDGRASLARGRCCTRSWRARGCASCRGAARRSTTPPAFVVAEVPLLFEADLADRYDATVLIRSPVGLRANRVRARGSGGSHAREREGFQLSEEDKAQRADYIIDNIGDLAHLREQVADVAARVLAHERPSEGASTAHRACARDHGRRRGRVLAATGVVLAHRLPAGIPQDDSSARA